MTPKIKNKKEPHRTPKARVIRLVIYNIIYVILLDEKIKN